VRVLVVSGIWPPDVGGPATHAPELAEFLRGRGHEVEVVTYADEPPAPTPYPVRWVSRTLPRGVRHVRGALLVRERARAADVVYSTGTTGRTALGAALARRPLVLKLTSDPAYERALAYGLHEGDVESFQRADGARIRMLRRSRDLALARAAHVVIPSASLRDLALGWGLDPERITVVPNPIDLPAELPEREELRRRHGLDGPTFVFAGRLAPQKLLGVALEALTRLEPVTLLVAGDGPDREALERRAGELGLDGRARFLGPQPREAVLELLRAADGVLLPSSWENFPHLLVEALSVGTPVVATAVGGVPEIVEDGTNGLLVPPNDPESLAAAIGRLLDDAGLRDRLRHGARPSVERFAPERIYGRLESILEQAART
jgi:glycosyltransferase involved in cell wall biosynthesis